MAMTTQQVRKTLRTVENLVALLDQKQGTLDGGQLRALRRLRARRSALRRLLAARENELSKPIIQLALWRDGTMEPEALGVADSAAAV